jgi:hypothetical protein
MLQTSILIFIYVLGMGEAWLKEHMINPYPTKY